MYGCCGILLYVISEHLSDTDRCRDAVLYHEAGEGHRWQEWILFYKTAADTWCIRWLYRGNGQWPEGC